MNALPINKAPTNKATTTKPKPPAINLFKNPEPAYQVRRYGWNAKLSLSILTNFAEFAVYDCRIKPDKSDGASIARLFYIKYSDYLARWDKLVALFSFEAVWHGEFDKYACMLPLNGLKKVT